MQYSKLGWMDGLRGIVGSACLLLSIGIVAAPLPEPFSLVDALALAEDSLPLRQYDTEIALARAELENVEASDDAFAYLAARARWLEPAEIASDQSSDDHKFSLVLEKSLYNFGRLRAARASSQAYFESVQRGRVAQLQAQRVQVMRLYFDVLLADRATGAENELLAIDFIRFDRLRERGTLGSVSDIDLLEAEARYAETQARQRKAEAEQRLSRARLAAALNRPGELPRTLLEPEFIYENSKLPDYPALWQLASVHNSELAALDQAVLAAQSQLKAASASRAQLNANVEVSEYSRNDGSADQWRLGVNLKLPLYDGGRDRARQARARVELERAQLKRDAAQLALQQKVLELWQSIQNLSAQSNSAEVALDYRDLYLDRSRALYELEVRSDLGDAMVRFSQAHLQHARLHYESMLAWEELDMLTGEQLQQLLQRQSVEEGE